MALFHSGVSPLMAQTVRGVVVDDSSKAPLDGALITLLNTRGAEAGKPAVRSDSLGRFIIHAGDMGRYRLRVTRIGYSALTSDDIELTFGGRIVEVTLGLTAAAARLGTVVVTSTRSLTRNELMSYVGFDLRRSKGSGKFLDSTELARVGRQLVGMLIMEDLRTHFGLEVVENRGVAPILGMLIPGLLLCLPEVWIDGFEVVPQRAFDRLNGFGAHEIYGVEVYGPRQLPSASIGGLIGSTDSYRSQTVYPSALLGRGSGGGVSSSNRLNHPCGAVAVWTKAYAREVKAKAEAKKPPPS
jgi:hypothetical protein